VTGKVSPVEFSLTRREPNNLRPADWVYGWKTTYNGQRYGEYVCLQNDSPEILADIKEVLEGHAKMFVDELVRLGRIGPIGVSLGFMEHKEL